METTNKLEEAVPSKMLVLAIGDEEEDTPEQVLPSKFYRDYLQEITNHFGYLLLDTRKPVEVVDDWSLIGRFGAAVHKKDNKTRSYSFYYDKDHSCTAGSIINGPIYSGREVMDEVKKRLSKENWISENEISTPLKAKMDSNYSNHYQFIQKTVSDALNTESDRLFNYLLFLHREHVKHRK